MARKPTPEDIAAALESVPHAPAKVWPEGPVTLRAESDQLEPYTMQRFPTGVPVEAPALTEWLKCQVEAGVMVLL